MSITWKGAALSLLLLMVSACAGGKPRFTDLPEQMQEEEMSLVQKEDLAGELLVTPPAWRGEQVISENPESVLSLAGMAESMQIVLLDTLPPMPDTSQVVVVETLRGTRKEYQIQVAITPSAVEAEDFIGRLSELLEGEEVFVIFTSPYYRIRVGHNAKK